MNYRRYIHNIHTHYVNKSLGNGKQYHFFAELSLRAGSPLSHARERRRAKRSAGRSLLKGRRESERAYLDLCIFFFFFISALPEPSEIPLVEKRERQENCQSIMFDERSLDPVIYLTFSQ